MAQHPVFYCQAFEDTLKIPEWGQWQKCASALRNLKKIFCTLTPMVFA